MNIKWIPILLITFLSGCSGQHLMTSDGKCLTCFNNPITGQAINHEPKANRLSSKAKNNEKPEIVAVEESKCKRSPGDSPFHCDPRLKQPRTKGSFSIVVPVDVDLAYARIKRKFNYRTHEELKGEYGQIYNMKIRSNTFKYNAAPGASYTLKRDFSDYKYKGSPLYTIIEMHVEKEGSEKTYIEFNYTYADPELSNKSYEQELTAQVKKALRL